MTWSLAARVARHAEDAPDALAVVDGATRWSWRDLSAQADAVGSRLVERGVAPGDRVALVMHPSAGLVGAIVGVVRVGAVAAPVPTGLTARETGVALEALQPAAVLRDAGLGGRAGTVFPAQERDPEAPAVVVLTSGTTGSPRAVVLAGRAMAASADAWLAVLPPATGWAMPLGLAHVAGLGIVWRAVRDRVPVTLLPATDPAALLETLGAPGGPSHVSLVAGQLVRLLDAAHDAPPPPAVRAVLLGGGPIPAALVERAVRVGWPIVTTYGLSEMGSGVTSLSAEELPDGAGTAGRALPGVVLTIAEPGRDGVGEIVVAGPSRFSGYVGQTPAAPDEPFPTGDLGRLDEAGRLVVADRRTDRIVRGGENIDPGEVEAALESHPAVASAAVVGRPDATWGQVPVAAIVPAAGADDPGDAALAAHARAALAGFKVPVSFTRLDALPRTGGGKLRRDAVRALLTGATTGELARPDGDTIGWRVTGTGARHVLLLHGTLSTARQLERLAAALATDADVTVHAIDRRGAGSSHLAVPRPLDVALHVDDVRAYLDARGIATAALVGISMGGVVALETAARIPARVDAVVAWEPPYGLVAEPERVAWFGRVAEDTRRAHEVAGPAAAAETFLRHVAGDAAWDRLPDRARALLEREGDGALADAGVHGLDPEGLERISAPVLLLTGDASEPFYEPIAAALATRIPGARRLTLAGFRHTSPITDPAPVADAIRPALDRPRPAASAVPLEPAR